MKISTDQITQWRPIELKIIFEKEEEFNDFKTMLDEVYNSEDVSLISNNIGEKILTFLKETKASL